MSEIEDICSSIGILQEGALIYREDFSNLYREMGMEEVHRFSLPGDQFNLKPEIEKIISGDVVWNSTEKGFEFILGPEDVYRFLSKMDRLSLKGINYSQEKPGLEEAVLRLSRSAKTAVWRLPQPFTLYYGS